MQQTQLGCGFKKKHLSKNTGSSHIAVANEVIGAKHELNLSPSRMEQSKLTMTLEPSSSGVAQKEAAQCDMYSIAFGGLSITVFHCLGIGGKVHQLQGIPAILPFSGKAM